MKKFLFIIFVLFLFSCSNPTIDTPTTTTTTIPIIKSATVTITNVYQDYYPTLGDYGLITFDYTITNTGNVNINYYEVTFEVICTDGSRYTEWDNGLDVLVSGTNIDYGYVDTYWKQWKTIKPISMKLLCY